MLFFFSSKEKKVISLLTGLFVALYLIEKIEK